jgi:hypothetical protein
VECDCRDEIQRIKAGNPDISHREAFSAAAKNVSGSLSLLQFFLTICGVIHSRSTRVFLFVPVLFVSLLGFPGLSKPHDI